jgi:thiol-disulfide isomerase/thioredoxin
VEREDLRGRIVLLDFWTAGCVNCLRVLDELRVLEERHGDALVVLGVHSPKFAHEAEPDAVDAAVRRYEVDHPVLDDADLTTWDAYAVRAWPTLVLVDPDGYVVAQVSGEGHGPELSALVDELVAEHGGALRRGSLFVGAAPEAPEAPERASALRFPGKAAVLPGGNVLVSDSGQHRLVELEPDLATVHRTVGDGHRGLRDGPEDRARFAEPLGLAVLPSSVAAAVGYDVVVADSGNHVLRGVRLADGVVSTVTGTGAQLRDRAAVGDRFPAGTARLSTPWDVAWWDGRVVIAMAGCHQLWAFDPAAAAVWVIAGTGDEGLRDGAPDEAFFAQPSGLAVEADGTLWVADAESSALRSVVAAAAVGAAVSTAVGQGLFDFGLRDGPAVGSPDQPPALLQHPLGVAVLPDGSVAIADTYNGAVRRYDPLTRKVTTLAHGLREPTDVLVDGADLIVVESAAQRLVRLPLPSSVRAGVPAGPRRAAAELAPGPRPAAGAVHPARRPAARRPVRRPHVADGRWAARGAAGRRGDRSRPAPGAAVRPFRCGARRGRRGGLRPRRGRRRSQHLRRVPPVPGGVGDRRPGGGGRRDHAGGGPGRRLRPVDSAAGGPGRACPHGGWVSAPTGGCGTRTPARRRRSAA